MSLKSSVLPAAAAVLITVAVFVVDLFTPIEVSIAVFYIVTILIAMRFLPARKVMLVAGVCVGLTVVSAILNYLLLPTVSLEIGVANRTFSIIGIVAVAFLATALRHSEASRALALEAADIGAWDIDLRSRRTVLDSRARSLLGLPPDAPTDRVDFLSLAHPADRADVDAALRKALDPAGPGRFAAEFRANRGEGGEDVWVAAEGRVELDNRRAVRLRGIIRDTSERKRAELHRELLVHELNHRVKNALATVQAIAQKTLRAEADPVEARARFVNRLLALARAHDILTRRNWENANLADLIAEAVAPDRVRLEGPRVWVTPKAAMALYMAVFELGANAVKYGALSGEGTVEVRWTVDGERLHLAWRERGGPLVAPPSRRGFGTSLLEKGLAGELYADVRLDFRPEGVVCTIDAPLSHLVAQPAAA